MNKFVFSALATTLVGASSFATDTEWPELDSELAALNNAPLTQDAGGPYLNGWLIGALDWNSDSEVVNGANDSQGFNLHAARIELSGSVGSNYGYVIGMDFSDTGELYAPMGVPVPGNGTAGLTDAYGTFAIGEQVDGKIGVFRMPFLRSSLIDRNHTLFIDRSFLGGQYSDRDIGVGLSGEFSRFHWDLAVQNGFDGSGEGWAWGGRVDFDVLGTSSTVEGAYNAAEGTNLNIGLAIQDDTSDMFTSTTPSTIGGDSRDAIQIAIDATLTMEAFSLFGEMVDLDDDVALSTTPGDSPFSVGAAYLFGENYEAGVRFDDFDDDFDSSRITGVLNRYINGHDAKWQLQFSTGDSDIDANEDSIISVGLALGF